MIRLLTYTFYYMILHNYYILEGCKKAHLFNTLLFINYNNIVSMDLI